MSFSREPGERMWKNAMGVGIPGTGMIGLPIAVALGALVGRSEYRLEVLRDVTPGAVEQGRRYIDEKRVCIDLKQGLFYICGRYFSKVHFCTKLALTFWLFWRSAFYVCKSICFRFAHICTYWQAARGNFPLFSVF